MAPKQPAPSKPATPVFKLKPTKLQREAAARAKAEKERKKRNDEIFSARQTRDVKSGIAARVGAEAGLPDVKHPFAGAIQTDKKGRPLPTQTPQPHKDETVTNATAWSELAAARDWRRRHGGLAPPAPAPPLRAVQPGQKAPAVSKEDKALAALENSRQLNFLDRHQLPGELTKPVVRLSAADRAEVLRSHFLRGETPPAVRAASARLAPRSAPTAADNYNGQGGQLDFGALGGALKTPARLLGMPTSTKDLAGDAIGALFPGANFIRSAARSGTEVARLGTKIAPKPDISNVPDIVAQKVDPKVLAANNGKAPTYNELLDVERFGEYSLTAEARKPLVKMAGDNGWSVQDAPQWNDPELIARAFNKDDRSAMGFVRHAASDFAQQAALFNVFPLAGTALLQSAQQRSPAPVLRLGAQLGEGAIAVTPHFGDRPFLENLYERPITTVSTNLPLLRGGGALVGRLAPGRLRMSGLRTQTLPTKAEAVRLGKAAPGSEKIVVPASREPLLRMGQAAHDAILKRGLSSADRASRPQPANTSRNTIPDIARAAAPVRRAGAYLEKRIESDTIHQYRQQATLVRGRESALAMGAFLHDIRKLPKIESMQARGASGVVESIIRHFGSGNTSQELAEFFRAHADDNRALIEKWTKDAEEARAAADEHSAVVDELRGSEDEAGAVQAEQRAKAENARADAYEQEILKKTDEIRHQEAQAAWVEKHPMEIKRANEEERAQMSKRERKVHDRIQNVAESGRTLSRLQTELRMESHQMDVKGQLAGDLEKRLMVVEKLEGPGSRRAIESGAKEGFGTPAYELAKKVNFLRNEHHRLRAKLHPVDENGNPPDASADIRSPEAQYHLTRARTAANLLLGLDKRRVHAENRQRRVKQWGEASATDVALKQGADPKALRSAQRSAFMSQEGSQNKLAEAARRNHAKAAKAEAEERAVLEGKGNEALMRAQTQLKMAEDAGRVGMVIDRLRKQVDDARTTADTYVPSKKVLRLRWEAERADLMVTNREIKPGRVDDYIKKFFSEEDIRRIGIQELRDAINEKTQIMRPEQEAQARALMEHSHAEFKKLTDQEALDALRFDQMAVRYTEGLKQFQAMQRAEGRDPFHVRMRKADEPMDLQPTRVSMSEQWPSGDFTPDMHFLLGKDLEGLTRKAVEGKMFELLADSPFVINDTTPGMEIPPGFIAVTSADWKALSKVSRNAGELESMIDGWKKLGDRAMSGARLAPDDEGSILISRTMREEIQNILREGGSDGPQYIQRYLNGMSRYRRWMLYSLPRTFVNNAIGNPMLAALQGAGVRTYLHSIHLLRQHPERLASIIRHRGPITNALEGGTKMTGYQSRWRHLNSFQEDNGNLMVYLLHAKKAYKSDKKMKFYNMVGKYDDAFNEFLERAAKGEDPRVHDWVKKSTEMFGEMNRKGNLDRALSGTFLFHRWVGHMLKLTLWTMPLRYPGRTAFLQQTAILANDYRRKHGVFPEWAADYIPLWKEVDTVLNKTQDVTWALTTSGMNPFSTVSQTFNLGTPANPSFPGQQAFAANLVPPLRMAYEWSTGKRLDTGEPFKDWHGNDLKGWDLGWLAQSLVANTPIANTLFPRYGISDDSFQVPALDRFFGEAHPRYEGKAKFNEQMQSPTLLHAPAWKKLLFSGLGASGLPIRPVDAAGERSLTTANRTRRWQISEKKKRDKQAGREYAKASLALWNKSHDEWKKSKFNPDNEKP